MTTLKDVPGGAEFIDRAVAAAADMALAFGDAIVDALIKAVIGQKHQLEAAVGKPSGERH
jgi:hypothetical protein